MKSLHTTRSGVQHGGWNRRTFSWISVKTKAIQTWTCGRLLLEWETHSGISAESVSRGLQDRTEFWLCRVCGERSLSLEGLHADLQLSRSTCHTLCTHVHSLTYSGRLWEAFFKWPSAPYTSQAATSEWTYYFLFFAACACLPCQWIVHSPLFIYFLQVFAVFGERLKSQSRYPTKWSKFLDPRKPVKDHTIHSVLVVLAAAESATDAWQLPMSPSNSADRITHAVHSIVAPVRPSKSLETVRTINSREGRHG